MAKKKPKSSNPMTREQAYAAMRQKHGDRTYVDEHPNAPTAASRPRIRKEIDHALASLIQHQDEQKTRLSVSEAQSQLLAAAEAVVQSSPERFSLALHKLAGAVIEVQRAAAAFKEVQRLSKVVRELRRQRNDYRCRVGYTSDVGGIGIAHIDGQGDTWEEALAKAENRK